MTSLNTLPPLLLFAVLTLYIMANLWRGPAAFHRAGFDRQKQKAKTEEKKRRRSGRAGGEGLRLPESSLGGLDLTSSSTGVLLSRLVKPGLDSGLPILAEMIAVENVVFTESHLLNAPENRQREVLLMVITTRAHLGKLVINSRPDTKEITE